MVVLVLKCRNVGYARDVSIVDERNAGPTLNQQLLPCNPRRTLAGFSRGCMVIVLKVSFYRTYIF